MILVTGATGLLGNNVVRELVHRKEQVRVLIRENSERRPLENLPIEVAIGDVCDQKSVFNACKGISAVIHAAAVVHLGHSKKELQKQVNVGGTQNVAEEALKAEARLVHISSIDTLATGTAKEFATEETLGQRLPSCPYVDTKSEAEEVVLEYAAKGLSATIVNPGFMLGPWDWKPSSGKMLIEVSRKFTPAAPLGGFNLCDVRDVTAGILAALVKGKVGQRYILGGHNLSFLDGWKLFAKVTNTRPPFCKAGPLATYLGGVIGDFVTKLTGKEPDVNSVATKLSKYRRFLSSQRAIDELGYSIRPAEDSVKDAWQWFQDYGYV
ncbi:MAG: NAD-dependent epimerase/dehydratase family protein [Pirellulaceae bacterium]|nr:NAD-dependent epimerase/dehydratase family protein [Pirellulaceae bacterium]